MTQMHKLNKTTEETGITLDGLATMIKQSFDDVGEQLQDLQHGQATLEAGQVETNQRLTALEAGQVETNVRLDALENGQDQMKLRLDNVAYRFEINELNVRVDKIEHKLGLS